MSIETGHRFAGRIGWSGVQFFYGAMLIGLIIFSIVVSVPVRAQDAKADQNAPAKKNDTATEKNLDPAKPNPQPSETALTTLKQMRLPTGETLLRTEPFDWLVLKETEEVVVVEPIPDRPSMANRLAFRQKQAEKLNDRLLKYKPVKLAEVDRAYAKNKNLKPDELKKIIEDEQSAARAQIEELHQKSLKIPIVLFGETAEPDYMISTRVISQIIYFEDLILQRAEKLVEEGNVSLAYDILLVVERRHRSNNKIIQAELESDEQRNLTRIEELKVTRDALRNERKPLVGDRKKEPELKKIDTAIEACSNEIKECEEELQFLRKKLRFARPADFPKPDAPQNDDILLPTWPRYEEVYARLILKDAEKHAARDDHEGAFRLLDEIWKPEQTVPWLRSEISKRMGNEVEAMMKSLVDKDDFRQARQVLGRLAAREPEHETALKWKADLAAKATGLIADARAAASRGDASSASMMVDRASRIWPEASGLAVAHRELTDKYQRLKVGVLQLGSNRISANDVTVPTVADERVRCLTSLPLFEPVLIDETSVKYRTGFFESWEPADLGRSARFTLKMRRADAESRPLITAQDVQEEVLRRIDPLSEHYDERFAGFVDGIAVESPTEFIVALHRMPLRMESLWERTVAVGQQSLALNDDVPPETRANLGRQRFVEVGRTERQAVYRRVRSQPASIRQRRVEEIVEVKFESWERALQGLVRGDISSIPHADLRDVKAIQADNRFNVVPYVLPRSHLLVFHPRSQPLRDGQLRSALLHALPRQRLMIDVLLKDASPDYGRLITGPFPAKGYGNNRLLEQPTYDPQVAAALALTAKKQLGGSIPKLKLLCPPDPSIRETVVEMIRHWKRVGFDVEIVGSSSASQSKPVIQQAAANDEAESTEKARGDDVDAPEWDIAYRVATFTEPVADIWPLLTMQSTAQVDALQPLPERTRRALLELERAIDWTSGIKQLHRLLGDLLTEARYVPLWEVDDFFVTRKHVVGIPARLMHSYEDAERWTVQSWFPTEAP